MGTSTPVTVEEVTSEISDASSEKEKGNQHFMMGEYNDAIAHYSESIAKLPAAATYANRALCFIKLNRYQEAEADCSEALKIDVHYSKAYYRRSIARKGLGRLEDSLEDAFAALRLVPNDRLVQELFAGLSLAVKDTKLGDHAEGVISGVFNQLEMKVHSDVKESKKLVKESDTSSADLLMNIIFTYGVLCGCEPFETYWGPIYMKLIFIIAGIWLVMSAWMKMKSIRYETLVKSNTRKELRNAVTSLQTRLEVSGILGFGGRLDMMLDYVEREESISCYYIYFAIALIVLLGVVPISYCISRWLITLFAVAKNHALSMWSDM